MRTEEKNTKTKSEGCEEDLFIYKNGVETKSPKRAQAQKRTPHCSCKAVFRNDPDSDPNLTHPRAQNSSNLRLPGKM